MATVPKLQLWKNLSRGGQLSEADDAQICYAQQSPYSEQVFSRKTRDSSYHFFKDSFLNYFIVHTERNPRVKGTCRGYQEIRGYTLQRVSGGKKGLTSITEAAL
ncbi:hypothetical protein NQZ68_007492 [Dissostichus eleginoides]|nr:hypothetical protein NQZ68_007492 [Dissostichus eleginoides]